MDSSTNAVPYQPYRSKRHSRTTSALSPEPHAPPVAVSPPPLVPPPDRDLTNGSNGSDPHLTKEHNGAPPEPQPLSSSPATLTNGHKAPAAASSSSIASSSRHTPSSITTTTKAAPPPMPSPTSTFRHVPPRTASIPHAPSPLRPDYHPRLSSHSLTVSPSFSRQSTIRRLEPQQRPSLQEPRSRVASSATDPGISRRVSSAPAPPSTHIHAPTPIPLIGITPPSVSTPATPSSAASTPPAASPSPSASAPPSKPQSPSPTPSSSSLPRRPAAPYRPGFQPKGVYRPRTDEFIAARSSVRDRDKVEQRRLERRLEKLIELHFPRTPTPTPSPSPTPEKGKEKPPAHRRASSLFDLDFRKNPSELWREVVESRIQGPKADIRAEEQSITPWEDDAAVSQCPLCATSFHPLTNRKHHCRLCGRIVCSLPPRPPTRTQTCSLLFVVDQRTGCIEEVGEGVDYGVKRRGSVKGKGEEEDKFLKGVRICRDCRSVLLRQQYLQEASRVPTFARLYMTLVTLEKDIEEALPQFQELILSLSSNTPSHHAPSAEMRKRLLDSFGEYDRLAKRIRQLPAPRGGSQDRVQGAILARANLFLQNNMFPLQTLPKPQKSSAESSPTPSHKQVIDADSQLAHTLQPLLEQEALLESFVEDARAQRKFEDARTLKANLAEIRAEIERIAKGG